ncbi:MAG: 30S ribosomal protein S1, partial [Phycisphaerae bacterium]
MVDLNLIREISLTDADIDRQIADALGETSMDEASGTATTTTNEENDGSQLLKARVINIVGNDVVLDVGLKSEGIVPLNEWDDQSLVVPGAEIEVILDDIDPDTGIITLSKRRADRMLNWKRIVDSCQEGDKVKGKVLRKIKGGLLVDIGVPVFLPASQVDIRRPGDVGEYIDKVIEAKVLRIDKERRNIVISRRKLLEEERNMAKEKLMSDIQVGQVRKGAVKNIADFGAFIDLGGIDGLLHITDMSWGRINHPSEVLKIDQEIEVKVLSIDKDKEKIALGLKQKDASPWENIETKYPVGAVHEASVVNIMSYGAFCKLEEGVEGLVHISEMSWTKRINHPSEVVAQDQKVKVKVLEINKDKQEISLGMKQVEENPWERV